MSEKGLTTQLDINNVDTTSFDCQALLHTYIRVPDIHTTQVTGFQDYKYVDKMANNDTFTDERIEAKFTSEVDRIYIGEANKHFNNNVITNGQLQLNVTCKSYIRTNSTDEVRAVPIDCVLWNAWIDKTLSIADLNNDAYLQYVCVEPGVVNGVTRVGAGEVLTVSQTLNLP
eukprot:gene30315-37508_t